MPQPVTYREGHLRLSEIEAAGGYRVVYADPPWDYHSTAPYDLMSTAAICSLPVSRLAAADSALLMWATWAVLEDALLVGRAWGFRYKTLAFVWAKRTSKSGKLFTGHGYWSRSNTEPCMLFVRGRPRVASYKVHQLQEYPEPGAGAGGLELTLDSLERRHSEKPPQVRDLVVEMMGDVPRCELFSRHRVEGWDMWGNQVPGGADLSLETA